jgi:hypothetical protein
MAKSLTRAQFLAVVVVGAAVTGGVAGPAVMDVLHGSQAAAEMAPPVTAAPANLVIPPMPTTTTEDAEKDPYRVSPAQAAAAASAAAAPVSAAASPPAPVSTSSPAGSGTNQTGASGPASGAPSGPTSTPVTTPTTRPAPTTPTTEPPTTTTTLPGTSGVCVVADTLEPAAGGDGTTYTVLVAVGTVPALPDAQFAVSYGVDGQSDTQQAGTYKTDAYGEASANIGVPTSVLALAAQTQQPFTVTVNFASRNVTCSASAQIVATSPSGN